jgi:hypothetical protein
MMKADGVDITLLNEPMDPFLKSLPTSILKKDEIKTFFKK